MKKFVFILLFISTALTSCNNKKILYDEINITFDNWETYLEVIDYENIERNELGDIIDIDQGKVFSLKEGLEKYFIEGHVSIEVYCSQEQIAKHNYNKETYDYTLSPYTDATYKADDQHCEYKTIHLYNNEMITKDKKSYHTIINTSRDYSSLEIHGDIVSDIKSYYTKIDIINIEGTLKFKK